MGFFSRIFGGDEDAVTVETANLENAIRRAGRAVGRVQGVGFRFFVQSNAQSLGITGWVKNMSDGSVTMELQGTAPIIEQLIEKIKMGRGRIKVTSFEISDLPVVEGEDKFAIKY